MNLQERLNQMSDTELQAFYLECENRYRAGEPIISDFEFSRILVPALEKRLGEKSPSHELIPEKPGLFNTNVKKAHDEMFSIENIFTENELLEFFARYTRNGIYLSRLQFRVTPKIDGMSGFDDGVSISTRGDKFVGEDVTKLLSWGTQIYGSNERSVGAGEFAILKDYFYRVLFPRYTTPRNFVVGLARAIEPNELQLQAPRDKAIFFIPYANLEARYLRAEEIIAEREKLLEEIVQEFPFPCDGVVIESVDAAVNEILGSNKKYHRWQAALKENNEGAIVTVQKVLFETGRTGLITPRAFFDPVFLSDANISKATCHNVAHVLKHRLGPGSKIRIVRSGKVIPYIQEVLSESDNPVQLTSCPACGGPVKQEGKRTFCAQAADCSAARVKKIVNFFAQIPNSNGIGEERIKAAINGGFDSIVKILAMTPEDAMNCGMGPKEAVNFASAIIDIITRPLKPDQFLWALGIPGIGRETAHELMQVYSLEELFAVESEDLERIKGIGTLKSLQIKMGLIREQEEVEQILSEVPFNFASMRSEKIEPSAEGNSLQGKKICFSGKMPVTRNEAKRQAEAVGAIAVDSVSQSTDILVLGSDCSDSKVHKAQKWGVKVLSYEQFLELL